MTEVPFWYPEFVAAVVARLPRDIDEATATGLIRDPVALEGALRGLLSGAADAPPVELETVALSEVPLKNDKSGDGWKMIEDVTEPDGITGETIELVTVLEDGGEDLIGEDMVAHVKEIEAKLGQRHAEYLLDHQEQLPEEFRRFSLIFPGTVWLGREGNHHVPCIAWSQGQWELTFGILEGGVDSRDRLARARA